ncbi:sulfatase-like hydrolase/transferase [Gramella sp. AN32]|uniref:Sulfatase-like hydrolase/transferase n=1 Tax=Christiangramia antarctica TaxID=2058158 RepID=A0ABW5X530_9FLAO|nr:sulfatase-like hydrolase/transferase [Gramella sp. AN32]MCM4157228.1 arylsulfatase [Gramella sp. AN32]
MRLNYRYPYKILLFLTLSTITYGCKTSEKEDNKRDKVANFSKPNILLIIADDAGWNDMSFHGSQINTPNIDKLAKNGLEFNRFYVCPTCSPTRASILTGMPASRIGIVAPISGRSEKSLPDSIKTLPQILKDVGYQTALIGKWHLGLKPESGPEAYGFDYSYGFLHGQIDQYAHTYKNGDSSWHRNGDFINEKGHVTNLLTQDAIAWIAKNEKINKPFFLQLAYSAPHIPLQEPKKWKEQYRGIIKDSSRLDYAAAMTHLDDAIGRVLKELDEKKLSENTLVVFMSDNGAQENWYPDSQYEGKYGPNSNLGNNEPLRDFKTRNYEGAIRVPAILVWKGRLTAGTFNEYNSAQDLMPTFLEIAGIKEFPKNIEGRSFWSSMVNHSVFDRSIYIRGHLQESLIEKPWKLIRTRHLQREPDFELYNVENDISETINLINVYPEITTTLKHKLNAQFDKDAKSVNVELKE